MVDGKGKGSGNERDVSKTLTEWWCEVPRQEKHLWRADMVRGGVPEYPADVAQTGKCDHQDFPFSVECKSYKDPKYFKNLLVEDNNSSLMEWWDKLERKTGEYNEDRGKDLIPILVFTKNYHPDYVMHKNSDLCLSNPLLMYEETGHGLQDVFYINLFDRFLNDRLKRYLKDE